MMEADRVSVLQLTTTPMYSFWGFDVWINVADSDNHLFEPIKLFYSGNMKDLLPDVMTSDHVI